MNIKRYALAITVIIWTIIVSCNKSKVASDSSSIGKSLETATLYVKDKPLYGLSILDSAISETITRKMHDSTLARYIVLRGDLLLESGMKDSAYHYVEKRYSELVADLNPKAKVNAGLWLVVHYKDDGNYKLAEKYLERILPFLENEYLKFEKARALNLEGSILTLKGDYVEAQKKLFASAKIFESMNHTYALGPVYLNIAGNYMAINDKDLAMNYLQHAYTITLQNHDSVNFQKTLNNLGTYYKILNPDSAEYYFTKSWNITPMRPWSVESLSARFNLAGLYYEKGDYKKSLATYEEVLDLSKKYDVKSGIYRALSGIGNVYEAMNKNEEALECFREGAELAAKAGETPVQIALTGGMVYMLEKTGKYKEAEKLKKMQSMLNDSILALEKQIAIRNLEILYNTEKAEREQEVLNTRLILMKSKFRTNVILLVIALIFTFLLSFLLVRMYRLYKQRDQAYQSLIDKYKAEIEQTGVTWRDPAIEIQNETAEVDPLYQQLVQYFEEQKPFLNPELKVEQIATHFKLSRRQIGSIIQEQAGTNFNGFVNKFRIQEAMRLLSDPERRNYKIEAIARESGFGSKANFYSVFTLVTGSKPSEFR
jgi:AraC-like DNA-binding protein/Flp pilus assembly protein TadD